MATKPTDASSQAVAQGENAAASAPRPTPAALEHQISTSRNNNQVFKSGPLFISSKGIGWTSWKKRWFVLTRTSLVFFRNDPNAAGPKAGEMNLTLGGIDLNNSASVDVKADKKLITVLFPDGAEGRAFTLKAETSEDLYEWKIALESALALAPTPTLSPGRTTVVEQSDEANGSSDQQNDKTVSKSMVIGRPVLLALEDIDGTPTFLEKALVFIEDHGVKVEGILRQAADVDEVHHRVREYEQGKTEFTPGEDAHVIGDCIKYILRELPSSPVPASCCNALVDAYRDGNNRLNAVRHAILETFPEPNRKLLQRILIMMLKISAYKNENRMSVSAVAACMSPLLLRPLLAGECQLEDTHMDVAGDGSLQLLQAAAAANHAQAIIILLLEEYKNIFGDGGGAPEFFSDSEEGETGSDDDDMYEEDDDEEEDGSDYEGETDDDDEHSGSETCSGSSEHRDSDSGDDKEDSDSGDDKGDSDSGDNKHSSSSGSRSRSSSSSSSKSSERDHKHRAKKRSPSTSPHTPARKKDIDSNKSHGNIPTGTTSGHEKPTKLLGSTSQARRWGRTSAKKNVSMESIDFQINDESEIGRLEAEKTSLQTQIEKEANEKAKLLAGLDDRKKSLHDRRLALEKDVGRLQDELQKERELRVALEAGHSVSHLPAAAGMDEKTKAKTEEIALAQRENDNLNHRADDLEVELNHEREQNAAIMQGKPAKTTGTSQNTMLQSHKESMSRHTERSFKAEGSQNHHIDGGDNNDGKIDSSRTGSSKFGWFQNNSSSKENHIPRATSTTSRKPAKDEGTLSKLTTRLNFLKERRTQIASELENLPSSSSQSSGNAKSPESHHNAQEGSSSQNNEKSTSHQSSGHKEHRRTNSLKPGTPPAKDLDHSARRLGSHSSSQHLNRPRSEGESSSSKGKEKEKDSR